MILLSQDLLNEKGVPEILLTLLEASNNGEELNQSELLERLQSISLWVFNRLYPQLRGAGLIQEKRGAYNRKILRLTKKGEEVAKALKRAREALEE